MGEFGGKKDDVHKALQSLRHTAGGNDWAFATVDAEVRRLRALEEAEAKSARAAATEILRLVDALFSFSPDHEIETLWCEHDHEVVDRMKLECDLCLEEIITGKGSTH